jgi:hypothetical protein
LERLWGVALPGGAAGHDGGLCGRKPRLVRRFDRFGKTNGVEDVVLYDNLRGFCECNIFVMGSRTHRPALNSCEYGC